MDKTQREAQKALKARRNQFLRTFYQGNKGLMALCFLSAVGNTVLNLSLSILMQQLLDIAAGTEMAPLRRAAWLVVGLLAVTALLCLVDIWVFPRFMRRASTQYKQAAFEAIARKSISSFSRESTSRYISALTNDLTAMESGWLSQMFSLLELGLSFLGALTIMCLYSPMLTACTIALSLLPLAAALITGNQLARAEKEVSAQNERFVDMVKDTLTGFTVVKSFKAEGEVARLFAQQDARLEDSKCRKRRKEKLIESLGFAAGFTSQMGVFLIGAWMAITGRGVTPGMVIAFVQMCNYILSPIRSVPNILAKRKAAHALVGKLAEAVDMSAQRPGKTVDGVLDTGITLRHLSFGYEPDKPVLKDLNLTIEAGRSYAVVGGSGCGKSTLLNLLTGGYDTYEGQICFDGNELRGIASDALFDLVSIVQQNVFVFNDTIRANITMFRAFPEADIRSALKRSGLSEVVERKGIDFVCGENGCNLSGGEKQRLSIARALLRKTPVLLIDEATAALDAATAWEVTSALLAIEGLTRIVVTHRLEESLLRRYDRILVMRGGAICESGAFDELMAQNGYFRSLYTVCQE